jgi:hypothetical protein
MNIPPELEKFANFMAKNPPPDNCKVGKFYKVPCFVWDKKMHGLKVTPVIGTVHEDTEIINFPVWHIHPDTRFIQLDSHEPKARFGKVVNLTDASNFTAKYYKELQQTARLELRRKKCINAEPLFWPPVEYMQSLQAAYADHRVVNGICPHRGISLSCGRLLANGARQCPGHGLAWNEDGSMAYPIEVTP